MEKTDIESIERNTFDDAIESKVPTAKDVLGKTSVVTEEASEVVDTPTNEAAGTTTKVASISVLLIGIVGFIIWYFFLRRK